MIKKPKYKGRRDLKRDGFSDNLAPLESLDLNKVKTFDDLVRGMKNTAFGGRAVGEAADVLEAMIRDKDCFVVGTFAGAMTVAKMGLLICEMIDRGMLQAIVSTGALMTHGMVEGSGMTHFKYDPRMDDEELFKFGYNRVYDTLELERNLDDLELIVFKVFSKLNLKKTYASYQILDKVGQYLKKIIGAKQAILKRKQKKIGIFTIGGGVPRNWAQQVAPYLDLIDKRVGKGGKFIRYQYGVRICPEPAHWGGLSGCTYSEGVSWGKMLPLEEGGRFAEVLCDATIAWPIILKAVIERMEKNKRNKL